MNRTQDNERTTAKDLRDQATRDQAALRAAPTKEDQWAGEPRRLPVGEVLVGDAKDRLRELPEGSIDTVVTSPPYFLLRNYGVPGQIGAEATVDEWVEHLLTVLHEAGRVLKPEGTLWLNLGDTYARSSSHGALPKGLVLAPERLSLALSERGWMVRNKIVWAKPNPVPASVRDRLTCTWEPLLLLSRSASYFFDLDAIRVPARSKLNRPAKLGQATKYSPSPRLREAGGRPQWAGPLAGSNSGLDRMKSSGASAHPLGKNPGDVWTIPTAAYRGAHFATFPKALVERPLLATCPERVCRACGLAWRRSPVTGTARAIGAVAVMGALRKSCGCAERAWQPGVVLDPFFGAGTVGVAAERLHRRWIGVELNPAYARQATERIRAARGEQQQQQQQEAITKGGGYGETDRTRGAASEAA